MLVRTVDTDDVVILVSLFSDLQMENLSTDLWTAFGMGKNYCELSINSIYENLGAVKSTALVGFHAFTG